MKELNPALRHVVLAVTMVPLVAAACTHREEPGGQALTVSGKTNTTVVGINKGPNVTTGSFALCSGAPLAYERVAEGETVTREVAIQNWSYQVAHTTTLGPPYSDWNKATDRNVTCFPVGEAGPLAHYRCTASAIPCAG